MFEDGRTVCEDDDELRCEGGATLERSGTADDDGFETEALDAEEEVCDMNTEDRSGEDSECERL